MQLEALPFSNKTSGECTNGTQHPIQSVQLLGGLRVRSQAEKRTCQSTKRELQFKQLEL